MKFTPNQLAFKSEALPCNPLPFLHELVAGCRLDTGFINTPAAHMLLLTINMQAFGSSFTLDSLDETYRLSKYVENNLPSAPNSTV